MKKILAILAFTLGAIFTFAYTPSLTTYQYLDIEVTHIYENKSKKVIIQRQIDPKCLELGINHETAFSGDMANKKVPDVCKKTFVTTLGSVQPLHMPGIQTVAELEVLEHILLSKDFPDEYILIDSRRAHWYENLTIPSAVNISYTDVKYDPDFPEDFDRLLKTLNIKKVGNKFDFSEAKKAIVFCNGSWCIQSSNSIDYLIEMGYPKDKLLWYRGGLQDWIALGFTTIRGDLR